MYECNELSSSGPQTICLVAGTLNIGHFTQTLQPIFFYTAMLKFTVNFYHFIPLSLTLASAEGHKVNTKQNLLASSSHIVFN